MAKNRITFESYHQHLFLGYNSELAQYEDPSTAAAWRTWQSAKIAAQAECVRATALQLKRGNLLLATALRAFHVRLSSKL